MEQKAKQPRNFLSEDLTIKSDRYGIPQAIDNDAEVPASPKRTITIEPLDLGYVVRVGCQTVAVESKETLIKNITAYLNNPIEYEKLYNKDKKLI